MATTRLVFLGIEQRSLTFTDHFAATTGQNAALDLNEANKGG